MGNSKKHSRTCDNQQFDENEVLEKDIERMRQRWDDLREHQEEVVGQPISQPLVHLIVGTTWIVISSQL